MKEWRKKYYMESSEKFAKDYSDLVHQVNGAILNFLDEFGGKVDFDDDFRDDRCSMCVTYDGGNHPEYATGYSMVEAVYINPDKKDWRYNPYVLDIEDENGYGSSRITLNEKMDLLDYLIAWNEYHELNDRKEEDDD